MMEWIFWILLVCIFYAYLGYPLLMWLLAAIISNKKEKSILPADLPTVTMFVTAYNEQDYVEQKMENTLRLNYPKNKLTIVWVTDGSDDKTNELLATFPQATVYYNPERKGKVHAMNRGMAMIESELVIFSDGNTILGEDSVLEIVKKFSDSKVGCVAGEKRIVLANKNDAASSGEGIYWKYESWLKSLDSTLGSCIGAAGELFALRTKLFEPVNEGALLDDFMISMKLAMQGYTVAYAKNAFAIEKASADVAEEMKRKIRIAAGSIQTMLWLLPLLNVFNYGFLSFQFVSHKVFRWVVVPLALVFIALINFILSYQYGFNIKSVYTTFLLLQIAFYLLVVFGAIMQKHSIKMKVLFVPYYFFIANWAMWLGLVRFLKGNQSVKWERAKRAS